jgi:DNA-binding response OmpR family regulator
MRRAAYGICNHGHRYLDCYREDRDTLANERLTTMEPLNVLIVEDDAMIGMLLAEMLQDMGYHVCAICATEEDAVFSAGRVKLGLMIVDEHLRAGSGRSAVERILRNGPVPCVFMGGAMETQGRYAANVLQKPFIEDDLIRAIQHVVGDADAPMPIEPGPRYAVRGH